MRSLLIAERREASALWLRISLGVVAGVDLFVIGLGCLLFQFLDALLQGGFQIGSPPPPLYSRLWGHLLLFLTVTLCIYQLLVALGVWGRRGFLIGAGLHLASGVSLVLWICLTYSGHRILSPLLVVGPAAWVYYAIRFKPAAPA